MCPSVVSRGGGVIDRSNLVGVTVGILIYLIRIRIQDFDDQKFEKIYSKKKLNFFGSKNTIYLSLGLQKGSPIYRRSLQPSKENIQQFKT
jgi:hypothetical protein